MPIRVAYREGPAADKAMSALVTGWREGGFDPTLVPIKDSSTSAPSRRRARPSSTTSSGPTGHRRGDRPRPSCPHSSMPRSTSRRRGAAATTAAGAVWTGMPGRADREHARPGGREKAWAEADDVLREDVATSRSRPGRRSTWRAVTSGPGPHPTAGAPSTSASRASTDPSSA